MNAGGCLTSCITTRDRVTWRWQENALYDWSSGCLPWEFLIFVRVSQLIYVPSDSNTSSECGSSAWFMVRAGTWASSIWWKKDTSLRLVFSPPTHTHTQTDTHTHTQPLCKFFMLRLKLYCSDAIRQWIRHNYRTLTSDDITKLLGLQLRKLRKIYCA